MSRRSRTRKPARPISMAADPSMRARFEAEKQRHLAQRRESDDDADNAQGGGLAASWSPAGAGTRSDDVAPDSTGADTSSEPTSDEPDGSPGLNEQPATAEPVSSGTEDTDADRSPEHASGAVEEPVSEDESDTVSEAPVTEVRRINIAIVAMGGQGGGVLSDWFVTLAEANGWRVQATSVPGVAQRTGATIYYLELFRGPAGAEPVLAMMPLSGDVDLVVAAEWMETGRAIMRGLVTPDRTTLVASTHRAYATAEKVVPGNGMADDEAVHEAAALAALRLIAFDMAAIAEDNGSVISASLFGAVAASGALPFPLEAFEAAVRAGGVGVDASLAALRAAHERGLAAVSASDGSSQDTADQDSAIDGFEDADIVLPAGDFGERLRRLPPGARATALEGIRRCVDYLDADYARTYLDNLESCLQPVSESVGEHTDGDAAPEARSDADDEFVYELARWLALRMCYEDPIRVADLKVRASRFAEIRREVRADDAQLLEHDEFLHPRLEEVLDTVPSSWAERLERWPVLERFVASRFARGRILRTSRLAGFLPMAWLAGRRDWRRRSRRHARECAHIEAWLQQVRAARAQNPPLAIAVARMARLIKGYSDTHERSLSAHARLSALVQSLMPRPDGGAILDYLIDAALSDADGNQLEAALAELARIGAAPPREEAA